MLKWNKYNNWRGHNAGTTLSQKMYSGMDDMYLLSSYLDRHTLVTNGNFIPKNELFIIGNYWVPFIDSK